MRFMVPLSVALFFLSLNHVSITIIIANRPLLHSIFCLSNKQITKSEQSNGIIWGILFSSVLNY